MVECDPVLAASRNIHQRTEADTVQLARGWEETPPHMNTLDVREFLQIDAITHVEMTEADAEEANDEKSEISPNDDEEVSQLFGCQSSNRAGRVGQYCVRV